MGKHLTPTQRRLVETAEKDGVVEVRTIRIKDHGKDPGRMMNQYEIIQLNELDNRGRLKILRSYQWQSDLDNFSILGETHVAEFVR